MKCGQPWTEQRDFAETSDLKICAKKDDLNECQRKIVFALQNKLFIVSFV
jgi:hypothetical protein